MPIKTSQQSKFNSQLLIYFQQIPLHNYTQQDFLKAQFCYAIKACRSIGTIEKANSNKCPSSPEYNPVFSELRTFLILYNNKRLKT